MRFFKLELALAAGLTASVANPLAAAQQAVPATNPAQAEADTGIEGEESETPSQDAAPTPPEPVSSPYSLDELIPRSAVDNAESWAAEGVADPAPAEPAPPEMQAELDDETEEASAAAIDDTAPLFATEFEDFFAPAAPVDIDEALATLDVPVPQPLETDPDAPTFAEIEVPRLVSLPELEDVEISDQLTFGFPSQGKRFPERERFIERFRALSTLEALDSSEDTVPQIAARARSDETLLSDLLRTYGYYGGEIVRQLSGGRRGVAQGEANEAEIETVDIEPRVRFDILPGPQYVFGTIDLGGLDDLSDPDRGDLREVFGIMPGDPLYADRIVAQASALQLELGESGYPFASLGEPALLIDHARIEGDLTLPVDPGGRFVFAGVDSADPDFLSDRHLERIARFDTGDLYQTSLQSDLRRAVLATGLVSSVVVTPREISPPQGDQPGEVVLDVEMERAPLRTVSGAIGYGTEDGFKLEAGWEHRNLFPPEGALRLRGILGTREQLASVTYRRSNFRARDQILTFDLYASDIDTEAVDARTLAVRGTFERVSNLLFQKPLSWLIGKELLYTDERNRSFRDIALPRQEYLIASLFGSATIDASDDLLDPSSGYRVTGFLAPEVSRSLGAESYYLRARVDASAYLPAGENVIAGRVALATIQGADPLDIAPSRRLYAGGGGSVRGYGFQGIGPRSDLGEPTGGGSLIEVALEGRIQTGFLDGAIEVVPFIDAGTVSAGSTPDFRDIRYGAGIGIRYKTTFGPIRVDVGVPLNPNEFDAPVVVYVSLGQAF